MSLARAWSCRKNSAPSSAEELKAIFLHNWIARCTYVPPNKRLPQCGVISLIHYIQAPGTLPAETVREYRETFLRELGLWDCDMHAEYGMHGNWEMLITVLEVHAAEAREREQEGKIQQKQLAKEEEDLVQQMEGLDVQGRKQEEEDLVQLMMDLDVQGRVKENHLDELGALMGDMLMEE